LSDGKILREFLAKDGRKVVLREPRWGDLDDLLEFINSLVDEGADIIQEKRITREQKADWLGKRLASIEKGETIGVVAEVDGKVVANSEVARRRGFRSHVGVLGIGVRREYRGIGIGKELMKTLIEESRKAGLKVLVLDVFDSNKVAKSLYAKMGFKDAGRIPKGVFKKGKYIDLLRMTLEL
jgi:L-amino acid N-acyltransferase YncA